MHLIDVMPLNPLRLKLKWEVDEGKQNKDADLDEVDPEWTLRVGGIKPDRRLYIPAFKPR